MNNLSIVSVARLLLICISFASFSQGALGQNEGRWYTVEMLVFKRLNAGSLTDEFWPQDLDLQYPDKLQYLSTNTTDNTRLQQNFRRISNNVYSLNNHRESLRRDKNYEVLYHQAWQQQMQAEKNSPGIAISGGKSIDNNNAQAHSELEGFVTFYIGRYLHINTNLWLSEPSIARLQGADSVSLLPNRRLYGDAEARDLTQALKRDSVPAQSLSDRMGERLARDTNRLLEGASDINKSGFSEKPLQDATTTSKGIIKLAQHRRMRSKELHYIDHPLMGILIYINPIESE